MTYDHIVVPDKEERRLRKVPLYYLISSETALAGEHLALALKRTGRGALISETTGVPTTSAPWCRLAVGSQLSCLWDEHMTLTQDVTGKERGSNPMWPYRPKQR